MKRTFLTLASFVALGVMLAGCGSDQKPLSPTEQAEFKGGGPGKPMTEEKKKAMEDFQAKFQKLHPAQTPGPSGNSQ